MSEAKNVEQLIEDNQGLVFYALNKFFPDRCYDEDLYQSD